MVGARQPPDDFEPARSEATAPAVAPFGQAAGGKGLATPKRRPALHLAAPVPPESRSAHATAQPLDLALPPGAAGPMDIGVAAEVLRRVNRTRQVVSLVSQVIIRSYDEEALHGEVCRFLTAGPISPTWQGRGRRTPHGGLARGPTSTEGVGHARRGAGRDATPPVVASNRCGGGRAARRTNLGPSVCVLHQDSSVPGCSIGNPFAHGFDDVAGLSLKVSQGRRHKECQITKEHRMKHSRQKHRKNDDAGEGRLASKEKRRERRDANAAAKAAGPYHGPGLRSQGAVRLVDSTESKVGPKVLGRRAAATRFDAMRIAGHQRLAGYGTPPGKPRIAAVEDDGVRSPDPSEGVADPTLTGSLDGSDERGVDRPEATDLPDLPKGDAEGPQGGSDREDPNAELLERRKRPDDASTEP